MHRTLRFRQGLLSDAAPAEVFQAMSVGTALCHGMRSTDIACHMFGAGASVKPLCHAGLHPGTPETHEPFDFLINF